MKVIGKRNPGEILRGIFLLSHPLPVSFHALGVLLLALLAAWPRFDWGIIALVVIAHTAMQLSIAIINDYCDRQLDALGKPSKPIPAGLVHPKEALALGIGCAILMFLLLLPLNLPALLISLAYLALGQGYNLGLKSTPWSGIVFALAIPLIPLYAFVGVGHVLPLVLWLVPIAALLGVALNLANSLPDLEEDALGHARTLAVFLGIQGSFLACPLLVLICIIVIGLLTLLGIVPATSWLIVPTLALSCIAVLAMFLLFGPQKSAATRKPYFYLVVVTIFVLAGGWLIGVIL